MRNAGTATRARAWLLRTFRGRSVKSAAWAEEVLPTSAGAPQTFLVGELVVDVNPRGLKAAGENAPSVVYDVRVSREGDPRAWSSSYGLPPGAAGARGAADAALDELDEIHTDPEGWRSRVTAGMSEEEVEAMEDSPAMRLDRRAAEWVGPILEPLREHRHTAGTWT